MNIIDSHIHIGYDFAFDHNFSKEEILAAYDENGVSGAIIQPATSRPYIQDTRVFHDEVYDFCAMYPGRFWGMACINPHFRQEDFDAELRRCVKDLGFVGVKITPIAHAVDPSLKDGMHVFEIANELGIPVMVHTGAGAPFSDPVKILPAIKAFKDLKIILAHAGSGGMYETLAQSIAKEYENVYLEPSWVSISLTKSMINSVGASRVMFSSDHPANVSLELAKYRAIVEDEKELEQVLSGTAIEVFNLNSK